MESRRERNIPQFNGDSYGAWKFRIKTVLEELQVYCAIEKSPPANPDAEWTEKSRIAKSTIVNFLGDAFLHYAEGSTTAKSIIDNLDKLYARRNLTAQVALLKQLSEFKLLPNSSLRAHFGRFDKLISDLTSSGANINEMDKICQLLATLPSSYDGVIAHLEQFYGDNFNLAIVKTHLLDHEAKMEMEAVTTLKDTVTESVQGNKRSRRNNRNLPYPTYMFCDFCGRQNHYIQDCHYYNAQNGNGNSYYNGTYNASGGSQKIFPFTFPPVSGPSKGKKRKKKNAYSNTVYKNRRLTYPNIDLVPTVKGIKPNEQAVKEEPVWVKHEPVEVKQEPVWVKQEPQWDQCEQPIKMEPGTEHAQAAVCVRETNRSRTSASLIAMHIRQAEGGPQTQASGSQQPTSSVQQS